MNEKQNVSYQYPQSKGGCGFGCLAIGCVGAIIVFVGVIVGGYYAAMHSSLPLRFAETMIEQSGEVEVDGLEGSFSSGFKADEFRFKTTDDKWSSLKDIRFEYENNSSWFGLGKSEMIIKEMSVGSGEIFADFQPDQMELNLDPNIDEELEELKEEIADTESEFDAEFGDAFNNLEFRIETMSISDLKFINPDSDFEISVEKIQFNDFQFKDGKVASIGELTVASTQVDIDTTEPQILTDVENALRYEGTFKQAADHRLLKPLPFTVEFGITEDFDGRIVTNAFDGQIRTFDNEDEYKVVYEDYSQNEWVDLEDKASFFEKVNLELSFDREKSQATKVSEGATCQFGTLIFSNFQIQEAEKGKNIVVGESSIDDIPVKLSFVPTSPYSSWKNVKLDTDYQDVWAKVLFDKPASELSAKESARLRKAMKLPKKKTKSKESTAAESDSDSEDGSAEDGSAEDGAAEDGAAEDGTAEDGTAEDGTSDDTDAVTESKSAGENIYP